MTPERFGFGATPEHGEADPWRNLILAERKHGVHERLVRALTFMHGPKDAALVFGDASLIQVKYLLEQGFVNVTDVDSSPSLLDGGIVPKDAEHRVERIVSTFDGYVPPADTFNFIYGKSLAFNPKETLPAVLHRARNSLRPGGVFASGYAGPLDEFRSKHYTPDELVRLYEEVQFKILDLQHPGSEQQVGLGGKNAVWDRIDIVATI